MFRRKSESFRSELYLSSYATKADLKKGTGVDTSRFAKKVKIGLKI